MVEGEGEVVVATSPQAEFASDEAVDSSQLTSDSVKQELQELGMTDDSKKSIASRKLLSGLCCVLRV